MTQRSSSPALDLPWEVTADQMASYHTHGWLLMRGVLDADTVAALHAEVMAIMEATGLPMTNLKQSGEYLAGSTIEALIHSARLRSIATQLLGGEALVYLPFTAVKSPGGGKFSFHQDNQYTRLDGPALNLWSALMPIARYQGCLRVLDGSHLQGTHASVPTEDASGHRRMRIEPEAFTDVEMEPGDCVAFSRLTVHGSGPNRSDTPRVGYAVQYHRHDVRAWWEPDGWVLLRERPRWTIAPVARISPPNGRLEGH